MKDRFGRPVREGSEAIWHGLGLLDRKPLQDTKSLEPKAAMWAGVPAGF